MTYPDIMYHFTVRGTLDRKFPKIFQLNYLIINQVCCYCKIITLLMSLTNINCM